MIFSIILMPHGVMVAQLTLDQFVKVRILMRQPSYSFRDRIDGRINIY